MPDPGAAPGAIFVVTANRCPQILCRLLGLVSQQGRLIERVEAVDTRRILRVTLAVADLDAHRAAIIAEKMRQMVTVRTVRLRARPEA
ncbi:MAG: hypothetical protein V4475_02910 [Pseudomonadota bacterium]